MTADATTVLEAQKFVSLTTFRKNGAATAAAMWIGQDGDHLFFWTPAESFKVKRIRNDPRVTLAPCGRRGKLRKDATAVTGRAEIVAEPETVARLTGIIRGKYGVEYRIVTFVERLLAGGEKPRVILRIELSP